MSPDTALPVAAMNCLNCVIAKSTSTTWLGLEQELRNAIFNIKQCSNEVFINNMNRFFLQVNLLKFQ